MRKIEKEMCVAIDTCTNWQKANTAVAIKASGIEVFLHGNCIARICENSRELSLAGWNTVTTRSRLTALLLHFGSSAGFVQRNYGAFISNDFGECPITSNGFIEVSILENMRKN